MSTKGQRRRARVLVALDGSAAAATALPAARALGRQLGAKVEALYVSTRPVAGPALRRRLGLPAGGRGAMSVSACVGEPAPCILRHTEEPGVELVVLTTHGRSVRPGRALGSVASAVIAASTRPILLVRPEAARRRAARFSRLLFPLDGTPTTAAALKEVTDLAGRLRASIDVLYVIAAGGRRPKEAGSMGAPRYVDQAHHEWAQWADEVMERLCRCCAESPVNVPLAVHVRQGEIGAEIVRFATQLRHDAIVLVRRSRLEPGRAHAIKAVLHHTPCPVLLVGSPPRRPAQHQVAAMEADISPSKFGAIIMDMDGVVTRTATIHAEAWKRLFDGYLKKRGARGKGAFEPFDADVDYRRFVDGKPRYDGVASFLAARGIALPYGAPADSPRKETVCGLGNKKDGYFSLLLKERDVRVYDSTIDLLRRVKTAGMKAGVFSASKHCEAVLAAAGVGHLFDVRVDGVISEDLGLPGKPDPAMLLEAAKRLGVPPERTVVIEDAIAGVQAGSAGRFGLVIGVNRHGTPGELKRNGADLEVGDLSEVVADTGQVRE
jgi:HAD superfamily hydrolase (TIGR01509 family)